ncbi:dockerin type I repeat-containing protein [Pirellulimonas nuda]|nr:dockerin type I repeat-containing protein [Pirellulimonas nuda]
MLCIAHLASAQTILFSDDFNRVSGTPNQNGKIDGVVNPLASSSWGSNSNPLGGTIVQTYEIGPAIRDGNRHQYVDGDKARFRSGWAEIQHDWAADSRVISGGGLSIDFDATIADLSNGWLGLAIGQTSAESTDVLVPPDNNSVFLPVEDTVDFGVLFGGINSAGTSTVMEIFEGDDSPNAFDVAFTGEWANGGDPNVEHHFRIEIATPAFGGAGQTATANIFVTLGASTWQPLANYSFGWDNDGEAYIAFSSNKDQGAPENLDREVRIDNLVIATLSTVVSPQNTGDYNGDGQVNAADYTMWRDTLTQSVAPFAAADGDGSGVIDGPDYTFWKSKFGTTPGLAVAGVAAAPEPSGLVLLLAAVGLPLAFRRYALTQR